MIQKGWGIMKWKSRFFLLIVFVFAIMGCARKLDAKTVQETALFNINHLNSVQVHLSSHVDKEDLHIDDLSSKIIYSDDQSYTKAYHVQSNHGEQYFTYQNQIPVVYVKKDATWSTHINRHNELDSVSILLRMLLSSDSQTQWKSMGWVEVNHKKCYRLIRPLDTGMIQFILSNIRPMVNQDARHPIHLDDSKEFDVNLTVDVDAKTLYPIQYQIQSDLINLHLQLDRFNAIQDTEVAVPDEMVKSLADHENPMDESIPDVSNEKPEQTKINYGVSLNNRWMGFLGHDQYEVTVNDVAHIIEAKAKDRWIRAFLIHDQKASEAAKAGYTLDQNLVSEQAVSDETNIKDSVISNLQTTVIDKKNVYFYHFEYTDKDTNLITQVYHYYIDLGDSMYAHIVCTQTSQNKQSDENALSVLSDFLFTT